MNTDSTKPASLCAPARELGDRLRRVVEAPNKLIAEETGARIRRINLNATPAPTIDTMAGDGINSPQGNGQSLIKGENGPALQTQFNFLHDVAFNAADGSLWIADSKNNRVRVVFDAAHAPAGTPAAGAGGPGAAPAPTTSTTAAAGTTPTTAAKAEPTTTTTAPPGTTETTAPAISSLASCWGMMPSRNAPTSSAVISCVVAGAAGTLSDLASGFRTTGFGPWA